MVSGRVVQPHSHWPLNRIGSSSAWMTSFILCPTTRVIVERVTNSRPGCLVTVDGGGRVVYRGDMSTNTYRDWLNERPEADRPTGNDVRPDDVHRLDDGERFARPIPPAVYDPDPNGEPF